MASSTPTIKRFDLRALLQSKDIVMAIGIVLIIGMMITPLPPSGLDFFIALNLALSVAIMLLTLYISQPLDFSVFPSLLLIVTLFRLGINIATSRSILLTGNAGDVVNAFGNLVVGGNYVVGVVIFLILMVIQFTVINSGAGRVAEVAARFTLDAMPGKQLSIDADLNAGIIDENQARQRRRAIEAEADFYGAMDGASKFVRGDSIAAIIITVINIIGGFVIGMLQQGLPLMDALQRYVLLTVGAGLATQIPALLVSSASGLIVTRSTGESSLGNELFHQLSNTTMLGGAAAIVVLLALIPGLPKAPFLLIGSGLGAATYFLHRSSVRATQKPAEQAPVRTEPETPEDMLQMVVVDPMEVEIGYALIPLADENAADNLLRRITGIRRQVMDELGLILPIVRIRDNLRLNPQAYRIKVRGQEVAQCELMLDRLLAIPGSEANAEPPGIKTFEPTFGLPALWIRESDQAQAELMGYTVVNPLSVISTHLLEIVRSHAPELLTRQMVQQMLDQLRQNSPASVQGVVPELVSLNDVQAVLRNLLHERVPIRDLAGILEVLAANAGLTHDAQILAEAVRQNMANAISAQYRDRDNVLHVFTLSPQLESLLRSTLSSNEGGIGFQIDASLAQGILAKTGEQMETLAREGHYPILLCPRELRLAFRHLVEQTLPNLVVLAYSEVSSSTKVRAHGMVEVD
jgi:flagellar biosynthesis protein FlhA